MWQWLLWGGSREVRIGKHRVRNLPWQQLSRRSRPQSNVHDRAPRSELSSSELSCRRCVAFLPLLRTRLEKLTAFTIIIGVTPESHGGSDCRMIYLSLAWQAPLLVGKLYRHDTLTHDRCPGQPTNSCTSILCVNPTNGGCLRAARSPFSRSLSLRCSQPKARITIREVNTIPGERSACQTKRNNTASYRHHIARDSRLVFLSPSLFFLSSRGNHFAIADSHVDGWSR